ncbi:tetratricopeptide repeat protein [Verrucomicrobium spinosum]|uniref:tetratricopeptide repeat protein n=1 Tax=Verrucomicrobium spinosum TaxID=2736 RepID=UPI0001744768|nr:hypothetical protein [Verrucomicrobium spinosum]
MHPSSIESRGDDLPSDIAQKVDALCLRGNELAEAEQDDEAICTFQEAYSLLPEPVERWYAATWIQVAIGDTAFIRGDLNGAAEAFQKLAQLRGWLDNPFVRMRRGQVALELGDPEMAANELAAAFMLGGYEIFDSEDDKYAEFALSKLLPPVPPVDHPLARFHLHPDSTDEEGNHPEAKKPWWRFF